MDDEFYPVIEAARIAVEHADVTGHSMSQVYCTSCEELLGYLCQQGCGRVATDTHGMQCG
jgi:hypothetical protein